MQELLNELDIIESFKQPGLKRGFGEITKNQMGLYERFGVQIVHDDDTALQGDGATIGKKLHSSRNSCSPDCLIPEMTKACVCTTKEMSSQ